MIARESMRARSIRHLSRTPRIYIILALAALGWIIVISLWLAGDTALSALLA